jgi:hypothetical protein
VLYERKMYVFGGVCIKPASNDFYVFDFGTTFFFFSFLFFSFLFFSFLFFSFLFFSFLFFSFLVFLVFFFFLGSASLCIYIYLFIYLFYYSGTKKWSLVVAQGEAPSPRCGHSATVFGGKMWVSYKLKIVLSKN